MKKTYILTLLMTFCLTLASFGQEMMLNGGLEDWTSNTSPTDWTTPANITQESTEKHGGSFSAKQTKPLATGYYKLVQNIPGTTVGESYTVSFWYKIAADAGSVVKMWSNFRDNATPSAFLAGTTADITLPVNGNAWTKYEATVIAPATSVKFWFEVRTYSNTTVYLDDVSFYHNPSTWIGGTSTDFTDAANWNNGIPSVTTDVIIGTGTYQPIIASNVSVKSLTINTFAALTVTSGNLTVVGAIANSGTMTLENNANLIQGGTTNTNTGNVIVKRNSSPLLRLDYTLWSSPVTSQNLLAFSPATIATRFYDFNTTYNVGGVNGAYSAIADPSATSFTAGKGYLIRMPDTADPATPTAFAGVFTGVPNNGTIPVALTDGAAAGLRYNAVGNPYPSPIKMQNFVFDNPANIQPTLYFWRKTNGTGTAYCTWVAGELVTDPGTFVTNNNAQSVDPLDIIQTGQGFFVEAKSGATSLSFNNNQRVANNVGQFFKIKQVAEPSKIWLNATNAAGGFSQMAITYFAAATLGVDAFDGKYFNDSL